MIKNKLLALVIPVLLISCKHKQDSDIAIYKALNDQLNNSTEIIKQNNADILWQLKRKLNDSMTAPKARVYSPEAMLVKQYSDSLVSYIDSLKQSLILNSDFNNTDSSYRQDDEDAVTLLFQTNGKGKELQEKLNKYKEDLLSVDSEMTVIFRRGNPYLVLDSFTNEDQYFQHTYTIAALASLSKLQNKIRIIENSMVTYCNDQLSVIIEGFTKFTPLVVISSQQVKAGQNVTIQAGIGSISVEAKPKIIVNGETAPVDNETGVATYTIHTSHKSGNCIAHVRILYIKPDGTSDSFDKDIEYSVVK